MTHGSRTACSCQRRRAWPSDEARGPRCIIVFWLVLLILVWMLPHPAQSARAHLTREDILDVREVAELLHMPRSTIFEYARRGLLPGRKLGRRWIFLRDELDARGPHGTARRGCRRGTRNLLDRIAPRARKQPSSGTRGWYPTALPRPSGLSSIEQTANRRLQGFCEVELGGLEPPTSWVRSRRSPLRFRGEWPNGADLQGV